MDTRNDPHAMISGLIDEVIVLDDNPAVDDSMVLKLTHDLAMDLHPMTEIAIRYGLGTPERLFKYLKGHPGIVSGVKRLKAEMQSEAGVEQRVRIKAMQATEELIFPTAAIAGDPKYPAQQRIDAFKQLSRVGGVDGGGVAAAKAGMGGANFVLNIHFRKDPEKIIGTTDIEAIPTQRQITSMKIEDDDYGSDEEI